MEIFVLRKREMPADRLADQVKRILFQFTVNIRSM
jgi:hypothetical protein